jgi:hypothetical protein
LISDASKSDVLPFRIKDGIGRAGIAVSWLAHRTRIDQIQIVGVEFKNSLLQIGGNGGDLSDTPVPLEKTAL